MPSNGVDHDDGSMKIRHIEQAGGIMPNAKRAPAAELAPSTDCDAPCAPGDSPSDRDCEPSPVNPPLCCARSAVDAPRYCTVTNSVLVKVVLHLSRAKEKPGFDQRSCVRV